MARPLRINYPGALYHVISRGNARQDIFLNERDRHIFLRVLRDAVKTHHLICHAYCLMTNHYHLLIETPDANLSQAMRDINGKYTQQFNIVHTRDGHLFQGRFKAFVIEKETYLFEVSRYIVLNPVRAGLVSHPRYWKWSSYAAMAGFIQAPFWLNTSETLRFFGKTHREARKEYRVLVHAGIYGDDPYKEMSGGTVLGSAQFIHEIWERTDGSEKIKEIPRQERMVGRPTLKELFKNATTMTKRNAVILLARYRCNYLSSEIASHLGLDRSTVGKICNSRFPT